LATPDLLLWLQRKYTVLVQNQQQRQTSTESPKIIWVYLDASRWNQDQPTIIVDNHMLAHHKRPINMALNSINTTNKSVLPCCAGAL
jgi:hypothetical protein